jgi:hypothetical protein
MPIFSRFLAVAPSVDHFPSVGPRQSGRLYQRQPQIGKRRT